MAMNCVLIDTDQGRYCQSHQTWHRAPVSYHSCTNDPDGSLDTCPACLEEGTHD